jgi:hypothetical protein
VGFVLRVVVAMLVVAPKGSGFVGFGVPKGLVRLGCVWWGGVVVEGWEGW